MGSSGRETANKRPFLRYGRNEHRANVDRTNLAQSKKRENINLVSTGFCERKGVHMEVNLCEYRLKDLLDSFV